MAINEGYSVSSPRSLARAKKWKQNLAGHFCVLWGRSPRTLRSRDLPSNRNSAIENASVRRYGLGLRPQCSFQRGFIDIAQLRNRRFNHDPPVKPDFHFAGNCLSQYVDE